MSIQLKKLSAESLVKNVVKEKTKDRAKQANPRAIADTTRNLTDNNQGYINKLYTDTKKYSSYSADVAEFLRSKPSLSVHKKKIKNFPRRKWIVPGKRKIASEILA